MQEPTSPQAVRRGAVGSGCAGLIGPTARGRGALRWGDAAPRRARADRWLEEVFEELLDVVEEVAVLVVLRVVTAEVVPEVVDVLEGDLDHAVVVVEAVEVGQRVVDIG